MGPQKKEAAASGQLSRILKHLSPLRQCFFNSELETLVTLLYLLASSRLLLFFILVRFFFYLSRKTRAGIYISQVMCSFYFLYRVILCLKYLHLLSLTQSRDVEKVTHSSNTILITIKSLKSKERSSANSDN